MRHVLERRAIVEATRYRLHAEAVYAGTAPGLGGEPGLQSYREFIGRMQAIINPPPPHDPSQPTPEEIAFFESIEQQAQRAG